MNAALEILRRRLALIVLCGLLGFAIPTIASVTSPDSYRATSRLFVATSAQDVTSANQGNLAAQSRARTYALMATGPELLVRAAQRSRVSISGSELANRVTVSAPPDTVLLDISATASSPQEASALSDSVAQELVSLVQNAERPLRGGQPSLGLLVLQPADAGASKIAAINPTTVTLATVGGVVIGIVLALLIPARLRLSRRRAVGRTDENAVGPQGNTDTDGTDPDAQTTSTSTPDADITTPDPGDTSEPVPAHAGHARWSTTSNGESAAPERHRRGVDESTPGGHRAPSHDARSGDATE